MNNKFTLYGGLLAPEDYYALGIGIGGTLAHCALSMDINRADTQFITHTLFHGYQWRNAAHQDIPKQTPISLSATIAIPTMAI
ncbi:fimbria/pilus outer membrane usher protein [Shigella boydii]